MRKTLFIILILSLAGCVSVSDSYDYGYNPVKLQKSKGQQPLTNIGHVYIGMSKTEIRNIMGDAVEIGYQEEDNNPDGFERITVKNPYREERFASRDRKYEVQYYFSGIKTTDGKITEDELVPLVFEGDKLIGKGSKYLASLKKNIN